MDQPDPMAERRRNSAGHYAGVDAAIAARPAQPTHIARVEPIEGGSRIAIDDGLGTTIDLLVEEPGRITLVVNDGPYGAAAVISLSAAHVLDAVLRDVAGMTPDKAAPITGSR